MGRDRCRQDVREGMTSMVEQAAQHIGRHSGQRGSAGSSTNPRRFMIDSQFVPSGTLFSPAERRLIRRLNSPAKVQRFLNELPYNQEIPPIGETQRSFRGVLRHKTAHCLEAALTAAVILEQHGYPPRLLSFESVCKLDHVIYVYQRNGRWGSIARSRDPGLHGRKPVFASPQTLAKSYCDAYVDDTGCVKAYAVVDLNRELGKYDWRLAQHNVWKVEQMLIDYPHSKLPIDRERTRRFRALYRAFRRAYPDRKPLRYAGRKTWSELPREFTQPGYEVAWVR
jgi:hypothetical protein